MQSQKANSAYLGDKFTVPVVLLSIPSDSHLCTLHSQHQLATSIQIQIESQRRTMVGDSLRAISSGLLQCLARRLLALWFHHAEALTPFRCSKRRKRKRLQKKRGLPSDAEMRGGEWIGRVRTVCWFSSPDFTLRDKSWSVMEGCMAVVSTENAMKTALLPSRDISSTLSAQQDK